MRQGAGTDDLDDFASAYSAGTTLTAWHGERLGGTGTLLPSGSDTAELLRMSTAADCRRLGIGSRLLAGLLDEARARRTRGGPGATAARPDASRLYERHGFALEREEDGELGRDAFHRLVLDQG